VFHAISTHDFPLLSANVVIKLKELSYGRSLGVISQPNGDSRNSKENVRKNTLKQKPETKRENKRRQIGDSPGQIDSSLTFSQDFGTDGLSLRLMAA